MNMHKLFTFVYTHIAAPILTVWLLRGWLVPDWVLLETTVRASALPRRTPVGNGADGDTLWIVAEQGRRSAYVRDIEGDRFVRVKIGVRWREGTAHLLFDDDAGARQRSLRGQYPPLLNAIAQRSPATDRLTVRIDLEPVH